MSRSRHAEQTRRKQLNIKPYVRQRSQRYSNQFNLEA